LEESARQEKIDMNKVKLRTIDTTIGVLTMLVIILYAVEYEILIYSSVVDGEVKKRYPKSLTANHILRCIIIAFSLVVCTLIYFHYKVKNTLDQLQGITFKGATISTSGDLKYMLLELFHNLIVCPPFIDVTFDGNQDGGEYYFYSLDGLIYAIVITRVYLVFRLYEQYSHWTNSKAAKIW